MALARKGLTLEEFLALPEEKPALEYANGVVTQKVSPKTEHSILQAEFVESFAPLKRAKIARAFPELRVTLAGQSPVPDVALIRWERIQRTPAGRPVSDVTIPPDLAIEIISPGETLRELEAKCRWYVENGVTVALLVNHRDESIRVFRVGHPTETWRRSGRIDLWKTSSARSTSTDLCRREARRGRTGFTMARGHCGAALPQAVKS
jgi:Uma2 family endonuclease